MKVRINQPVTVSTLHILGGKPAQVSVSPETELRLEGLEIQPEIFLGVFSGLTEITTETNYTLSAYNKAGKRVNFTVDRQSIVAPAKIPRDEISYTSLEMPRPETPIERMLRNQQMQINKLLASKAKGPQNAPVIDETDGVHTDDQTITNSIEPDAETELAPETGTSTSSDASGVFSTA